MPRASVAARASEHVRAVARRKHLELAKGAMRGLFGSEISGVWRRVNASGVLNESPTAGCVPSASSAKRRISTTRTWKLARG